MVESQTINRDYFIGADEAIQLYGERISRGKINKTFNSFNKSYHS